MATATFVRHVVDDHQHEFDVWKLDTPVAYEAYDKVDIVIAQILGIPPEIQTGFTTLIQIGNRPDDPKYDDVKSQTAAFPLDDVSEEELFGEVPGFESTARLTSDELLASLGFEVVR